MRVRVLFFGVLKDIVGCSEDLVEVAGNSTLGALFDSYSARFETLRSRRPSILFARNREFATPDTTLAENDEVAFLPPVSGGTGLRIDDKAGHVFAIVRCSVDTQELTRSLQRDEDGAVVVFEGIVRNNTKGRATAFLEYESYQEMALGEMARIGREIATKYEIGRIGMVHRLGRLEIGEASVVIVTTAPHRRPAFEAALEAINRLKREVPIWKKEFFADGAVWVEGDWDERLLAASGKNADS